MADPFRLTAQTVRVLEALLSAPAGEHYGFELAKATELQSGTLYPILARLEAGGLLTSGWEQDESARSGPRRRYYSFSAGGAQHARQLLAAHRQQLTQQSSPRRRFRPALEGSA